MKFLSEVLVFLTIACNVFHIEAGFEQLSPKFAKSYAKEPIAFFADKHKKALSMANIDINKIDLSKIPFAQFIPFFDDYVTEFKKEYKDDKDRETHMDYFRKTIERIQQHNKKYAKQYIQGINELSDMNYTEIQKEKTGFKVVEERNEEGDVIVRTSEPVPPVDNMPEEWDWRKYGVLTAPRNQGKCGSCWSFAAATVLESHNMKRLIAEGKFDRTKQVTVSEQNLIDCSAEKFGSIGCDGGMPQQAWRYVAANGGVDTVESYPYQGKKEDCKYDPNNKADVIVSEAKRLKTGEDKDLATAIYNYGPVAIAVHVTKDMVSYKSGIFDDLNCSAKKVNHAVVAVGYHPDYFIVRNSWGPKWGEQGYIRISRKRPNNCGVSQQGYYPIIPNAVETDKIRDKFNSIDISIQL